jgi:uncharacterized protein YbjT (DUF2867 family)
MILVAGGTGRLGSLVAGRLCERGLGVRVLSRGLSPYDGELDPRVEVVRGDVRDPASLAGALKDVGVVVSAVQGFVGPGGATPETVDKQGNVNLVDAAKEVGADFVLVSMTDAAPDSPMELARMKYAAEQYLKQSGLRWTIIRGAAFVQAWVSLLGETTNATGRPLVFGSADNPIAWVDVDEVAALVELAVVDPGLRGRTFEICGPEPLSLMQLAQAVMDHQGVAGHPRRVPRPMLHVMANTVGRLKPERGRRARAALAMDVLPLAVDPVTRAEFPDLPRRRATQVLDDLVQRGASAR